VWKLKKKSDQLGGGIKFEDIKEKKLAVFIEKLKNKYKPDFLTYFTCHDSRHY